VSQHHRKTFSESRASGWGMGLYRKRSEGWIAGLCSGLARYWDVPNWVVRLAAMALLISTGALAFWLYIVAWVAIAPAPSRWSESAADSGEVEKEFDENRHVYRRKTAFRYTDAPSEQIKKVQGRMAAAVTRVEAMEQYVASRQYDLNREFSKR